MGIERAAPVGRICWSHDRGWKKTMEGDARGDGRVIECRGRMRVKLRFLHPERNM